VSSPNLSTFTAACNALGFDVILQPVTQADSGANNIRS
jgi:hypothetical protein